MFTFLNSYIRNKIKYAQALEYFSMPKIAIFFWSPHAPKGDMAVTTAEWYWPYEWWLGGKDWWQSSVLVIQKQQNMREMGQTFVF